MEVQYVLLAFNIVLGIAAFFAGIFIRDLSQSVKDLQKADTEMLKDRLTYATKAEVSEVRQEQRDTLSEMRQEQRDNFAQVFTKLDNLVNQVAQKADRHEFNPSRFPG